MYDKVKLALELAGLSKYYDRFKDGRLDDRKVSTHLNDPSFGHRLQEIFHGSANEVKFKRCFRKLSSEVTEPRPDYDQIPVKSSLKSSSRPPPVANQSRSVVPASRSMRKMPDTRSALKKIFDEVDTDKSGRIDADELYRAFKAGGSETSLDACRLMIGLFDQGQGTIDLLGFLCVTMLLGEWITSFLLFDVDGSGYIDRRELVVPLLVMAKGYSFDQKFVDMVVDKFGSKGNPGLDVDGFINACAFICTFSNGFREKDPKSTGYISYQDFLTVVLNGWN